MMVHTQTSNTISSSAMKKNKDGKELESLRGHSSHRSPLRKAAFIIKGPNEGGHMVEECSR